MTAPTLVCPTCGGPKSRRAKQCRGCKPPGQPGNRGGGRPSTLTPDVRDGMCELLRTGMPIDFVCGRVGVHRSTYRKWIQRADDVRALIEEGHKVRPVDSQLVAFTEDLEIARMFGGGWLYQEMLAAPANLWPKYCAALERQFHDLWSTRFANMAVDRKGGRIVEVKLSFEAAPDLVEQLRER